MAQESGTPPWSFVPVTISSIKNLRSGLSIFHCTKSSCVKADSCQITNIIYEDMGWKMFPANPDSEFKILRNDLTVSMDKLTFLVFDYSRTIVPSNFSTFRVHPYR